MTRYKGRQSAKAKTLSANRLRKLLNYAPATGVFRWRGHKGPNNVGTVAGSISRPKGYRLICIDGKIYRANRLAWLYMTGKWPKLEIGYINHKTSDTRWAKVDEESALLRAQWEILAGTYVRLADQSATNSQPNKIDDTGTYDVPNPEEQPHYPSVITPLRSAGYCGP
jgi:hypothetical protein